MTNLTTVTRIKLPLANAYLVRGKRPILVDTGAPGDAGRIVQALRGAGVEPEELSLILLTHGHGDHAGSANELAALSGAPVALHRADDAMARSGRNVLGTLTSWEARLLTPFVDKPFPPVAATHLIDEEMGLHPFGVDGRIVPTPGHTAGSVSILLENGDAIVGDMLMGGRLGGAIMGTRPRIHYFVADFALLQASLARVLAEQPARLLVGHGGPLAVDDVRRWQAATLAAQPGGLAPAH